MLSQEVTNQVGLQREAWQEGSHTSRVHKFLRMNPPSFTRLSTSNDPENFVEEWKKVFEVMHFIDVEKVEFAAY